MSITNPPKVVSFEARDVVHEIRETAEGSVRSIVEYNKDDFNPLYVDDFTLSFYDDEADMMSHFEEIHSYVHLDFTEMDLFTDELFPVANRVRYLATSFDTFTLIRIYIDREGLFIAIDPDEPVEPIVHAVEDAHDIDC